MCEVVLKCGCCRSVANLTCLLFSFMLNNVCFVSGTVTMMPGDSQSNKVAIAADATIGKCQNCSVLHQVRSVLCCRF